jgi:hypothetical protein
MAGLILIVGLNWKAPTPRMRNNALCERLISTMRRECLDWLIPIHEGHLRCILRDCVTHYNRGRPHASLGPGIPDPLVEANQRMLTGHRLPEHGRVIATPILGGLHHEYRLARTPRDRPQMLSRMNLRITPSRGAPLNALTTRDDAGRLGPLDDPDVAVPSPVLSPVLGRRPAVPSR